MELQPGTRLGSYEIIALIGAGGMGEVYRAHDPRLRRDVAIKVLPADLTDVNHPNIATIDAVDEADGLASDLPAAVLALNPMHSSLCKLS